MQTFMRTNESQEGSPFPAGEYKPHINRRAQRHSKHKTEKNIKDPQKKYRLGTVSKIFKIYKPIPKTYLGALHADGIQRGSFKTT